MSPCPCGASQPSLQVLVQEPYGLGNAARAITAPKHWLDTAGLDLETLYLELETTPMNLAEQDKADLELETANLNSADLEFVGLDLETSELELVAADLDRGDLYLEDLDLNLDMEDTNLDTDLYSDLEW